MIIHPSLRIALICPFSIGPARGNITTVRRIGDHLPKAGCQVATLPLDTVGPVERHERLNQVAPDLLHAFHAYHSGPTARQLAQERGIPYLITITGSDLFDPEMRNDPATRQAVADAAAITCFDPLVALQLTDSFPEAAGKLVVIPQGVAPLPVNQPFPHPSGEFLILLPAAQRAVKGITNALDALAPLTREFPSLRLLLAGGELDPAYGTLIRKQTGNAPWVQLMGDIPHQRMGALYAAADLVLNCSLYEGGMANTLLEAMIMGRPVLARNVTGNRSVIRHGETGWLYETDNELAERVRLIMQAPQTAETMGEAGRVFVRDHCSPMTEAKNYARLYEQLRLRNKILRSGEATTSSFEDQTYIKLSNLKKLLDNGTITQDEFEL